MSKTHTTSSRTIAKEIGQAHSDVKKIIVNRLKAKEILPEDAYENEYEYAYGKGMKKAVEFLLTEKGYAVIKEMYLHKYLKPPTSKPIMQKTKLDTNEMQVGQAQSFDLPNTGHIDRENFRDEFATVDTPNWKDTAKSAAFMEEPVHIIISDTEVANAEQVIQLAVQGKNQFVFRGAPIWIKRKYLEVLARARPESISTQEFTDTSGNRATRILKTMGLKYPFRVLEDKNPDGSRWLEAILKEQA
jgi:hypothetical protein